MVHIRKAAPQKGIHATLVSGRGGSAELASPAWMPTRQLITDVFWDNSPAFEN